jgi:hypothetical protein
MKLLRLVSSVLGAIVLLSSPTASFAIEDTWIRTYLGGYGHSVYETNDGGAMLAGTFGAGFACCQPWLVKLAPDGSVQWQVTYDAPGLGGANNVVPTRDGGYVMSGEGTEFMVLKLDADGNVQWAKSYGDGGHTSERVLESNEGNFLVTGATWLGDGNAQNGRAILLNPDGNVLWEKVYGTPFVDFLSSATVGYNGNFIVAGSLRGDYWVMELDKTTGAIVWQKTYGGGFEDMGLVVTKILKNRYLVVGNSDTFSEGGLRNWWALILNKSGKLMKEFSLGGADAEDPHTAISTSDGGFMIGGGTGSFGAGLSDIWLVKFDSRSRVEWQKAYGLASTTDHAWHIEENATGYSIIGDSYSFPESYEVWLMNVDRNGNIERGECGAVVDTNVSPWRTRAIVRDADALTLDITTGSTEMEVSATPQDSPIEACSPR